MWHSMSCRQNENAESSKRKPCEHSAVGCKARKLAVVAGVSVCLVMASASAAADTLVPVAAGDQASGDPAQPDAAELLKSMSTAMSSLNYEGSFVHAQGSNLTAIDFLHAAYPEGEFERMVSLDGEAREVIRTDTLVTCIWPGSESVIMTYSQPRELLPNVEVDFAEQDTRYQLVFNGHGRVAERDTYVIDVIPRDIYRYGYRFWIDEETHIMLRSMLLDGPDQPVEQVVFTSIEFLDKVDRARFDYSDTEQQGGQLMTWIHDKKEQAKASLKEQISEQTTKDSHHISFSSLPPGYSRLSEQYVTLPDSDNRLSHVMLSDGIASVSVYVDYQPTADHAESLVGLSRMGAMSAYGYRTDSAVVTVVGAVPEATVKSIGAAVVINQ